MNRRSGGSLRKVEGLAPGEVRFCHEAGPCGYALPRRIEAAGKRSIGLSCAELLTQVASPSEDDEAVRDLCRARDDARQDLTRCRHRLDTMLLRRGITYLPGKKAWTQAHRVWLRGLRIERMEDQSVFDDYLLAVEQIEERLEGFREKLEEVAVHDRFSEPVGWLRCFRGIDTITAVTPAA